MKIKTLFLFVLLGGLLTTVGCNLFYPPSIGSIKFLSWKENSNGITITGALNNPTSVVIPSTINGKPVTSIGDYAFTNCTGLTNITLPNSITSIGDWAFEDCTGLTNITLPNSITSIGGGAFAHCTGLTSISLPNSITNIRGWAFAYCTGLTSISLPNSITSIGYEAFYYCTGLTNVTVQATNPPSLGGSVFNYNAPGRKIYVPSGSLSNYQAQWSGYSSDITNY